jgi:hypothetical protein
LSKEKNDSFYDLSVAREMAERSARPFRDGVAAEKGEQRNTGARYLEFSASRVRDLAGGHPADRPASAEPGAPLAPPPADSGLVSSEIWDEILDRSAAAAGVESAFVLSKSGSLVAGRGPEKSEAEMEVIGRRVMVAVEQALRVGIGESESVFLDLGSSWLCALPFRGPSGETVTACVVGGPWRLQQDTCLKIRDAVKKALS